MTSVSLPDPVLRRTGPPRVDARALERALRDRARRRGPVRRGQPRRIQHRRLELPPGTDRRRGPPPAVRDAPAGTMVLAYGFSCRTQIEQGDTGRTPVHLAEVLAAGLRGEPVWPSRPAAPGAADYMWLEAEAAGVAGLAFGAVAWRRRSQG